MAPSSAGQAVTVLPERASSRQRALRTRGILAVACVLVWIGASALSRIFGIWPIGMGALLLAGVAVAVDGRRLRESLRPTPLHMAIGVAAGVLMIGATYALYPVVRDFLPAVVPQTAALYLTLGKQDALAAPVLLTLVAIAEDLVWRAVVQDAAQERWGSRLGLAAAVLLYGGAVVPLGTPLLVVVALCCGLYWSALRSWTNSLAAPMVAHVAWDLVVVMLFPLTGG